MADLDDFFAKKDRKKSKAVKKFATTDELAKKLEDTKQKPDVKPKKEKPAQDGEDSTKGPEEEEWKEYEETVKDYTGLKIQVLQGGNGSAEMGRDNTFDDSAPDNGKSKGPWNKPQGETTSEPVAAPPPAATEEPKRESKPSVYVPPSTRRLQQEIRVRPQNNRIAPDIHNDDNFPVLGAMAPPRGGGGWSTAGNAGGTGGLQQRTATRQQLSLGNRFNELRHDS